MIESGANRHEDVELPQTATSFPRVVSMRRAGAFAICLTLLAAGKTSDVTLEMPEKGGVPAAPKPAGVPRPKTVNAGNDVETSIDDGTIQTLLHRFMRDRGIVEVPTMKDDIRTFAMIVFSHLQAHGTPVASFHGDMIAEKLATSGIKQRILERNAGWVKRMHENEMPVADTGSRWSGIEIHASLERAGHGREQVRFKLRPIIELPEGKPDSARMTTGPWLVTVRPQNIDEYAPVRDEWDALLDMLRATGTRDKAGADLLFEIYTLSRSLKNWEAEQPAAHE